MNERDSEAVAALIQPREGETVTIKFDPNKRGEFVLLDENYEVESFPISSSTLRPPIST